MLPELDRRLLEAGALAHVVEPGRLTLGTDSAPPTHRVASGAKLPDLGVAYPRGGSSLERQTRRSVSFEKAPATAAY